MNLKYLEEAKTRIGSTPRLVNMVSLRARQLMHGTPAMVKADDAHMTNLDFALKEIVEGKLSYENVDVPEPVIDNSPPIGAF